MGLPTCRGLFLSNITLVYPFEMNDVCNCDESIASYREKEPNVAVAQKSHLQKIQINVYQYFA